MCDNIHYIFTNRYIFYTNKYYLVYIYIYIYIYNSEIVDTFYYYTRDACAARISRVNVAPPIVTLCRNKSRRASRQVTIDHYVIELLQQ